MPDKKFLEQEDTLATEEVDTDEPPMYRVVLLNDDYTSMDFVVMILEAVFSKTPSEAQEIMLSVHKAGSGVAGVYPREVAESKVVLVQQHARAHEFPLRCTMEPE